MKKLWNKVNKPEREPCDNTESTTRAAEKHLATAKVVTAGMLLLIATIVAVSVLRGWWPQHEADTAVHVDNPSSGTYAPIGGGKNLEDDAGHYSPFLPVNIDTLIVMVTEEDEVFLVTCTECGTQWHVADDGELLDDLDKDGNAVPFGTNECSHQDILTDSATGKTYMICLEPAVEGYLPLEQLPLH